MSRFGQGIHKYNQLLKEFTQQYGDCLTRLDQQGFDTLFNAFRSTKDIIGEPNLNSEAQIGHHRRFLHSGKIIGNIAEMNNLEVPAEARNLLGIPKNNQ